MAQPLPTRHANMTVRNVGGCLIDLASRDHQSDQLSAFFPGRRQQTVRAKAQDKLSSDPNPTDRNGAGNSEAASPQIGTGSVTVFADATATIPSCSITWSLDADSRALTVTSRWTNSTDKPVTLKLEDELRADGGMEAMIKSPDGTHDLYWVHDIFWQQAYGVYAKGFRIRSNSNGREGILVFEQSDGQAVELQPGESFSLERQILVAKDLPGLMAIHDIITEAATPQPVTFRLTTAEKLPVPGAHVLIRSETGDRGTLVTDLMGAGSTLLPVGKYSTEVSFAGMPAAKKSLTVHVKDGNNQVDLEFENLPLGSITAEVTDSSGNPLPAKVQFKGTGGTPTPDWGPETAERFVRNVAYTPDGTFQALLHAGEYEVIVSRGPEYDAEFTKVTVEAGKQTSLNVKLPRVVQTEGWVSADFHSHSSPSGDNTGSQVGRVLNLAAEHIEFAPCTEHNRISSYEEHIRTMRLEPFLATVSGIELTGQPLPLNHQNAFPLVFHPRTQDGGGPVTDSSPETQMERLVAWDNHSEKLIQQNHPDIGWLFFDRDGNQQPDEGYSRSFGLMNVMEVHPIDPLLNPSRFLFYRGKAVNNLVVVNWLQLLNQGHRIYGVVNTDSHYNFHGSGGLRMWLKSATDDPAAIDHNEMRESARAGHAVMSNGPFLEVSFKEVGTSLEPVIAGDDLIAHSRRIQADIRVQCPNWVDVDTVMVLVNGRRRQDLMFTRETHADFFSGGPVKFDRTLEFELAEDSHLVVLVGHQKELLGDVTGPMWGEQHPAALSNPVFADVNGDGFQPNRDQLDFPLPVKFIAEK